MLARRLAFIAGLVCTAPAFGATHDVIVRNFEFDPPDITVVQGDLVRWTWESGSHTVTSGVPCTADEVFFDDPMTVADPDFEWTVPGDLEGVLPEHPARSQDPGNDRLPGVRQHPRHEEFSEGL